MEVKFKEIFSPIKDPRVNRTKKHPLLDIIALSICGIIAGCESFEEISDFGKAHIEWFNNFLELPHGIGTLNSQLTTLHMNTLFFKIFNRTKPS